MHLIGDSSDLQNMVLRPMISSSAGNSKIQTLGPNQDQLNQKRRGQQSVFNKPPGHAYGLLSLETLE